MYTLDNTKNQLSYTIDIQQRNLNHHNAYNLKSQRNDIIIQKPSRSTRKYTQHKAYLHKNLADIQKQQIQLRKLQIADNLIKDRIEDQQNLLKNNQRYPYGKQNVDISEDVLQRYKGNYIQQSKVLEKFRLQAELMKKTGRIKGSKQKTFQWVSRENSDDNKKKQQYLKKMRQTIKRQYQQQRKLRQFQKKYMKNITKALSSLTNQLYDNSFTLQKGIRDLQKHLKPQSHLPTNPLPKKHTYKDILDLQKSSQKIPVIIYQNKSHDARLYFSDIFKNTNKIVKQKQSNIHNEEYKQVVQILNQNNRRLRYLNKLNQKQNYSNFY